MWDVAAELCAHVTVPKLCSSCRSWRSDAGQSGARSSGYTYATYADSAPPQYSYSYRPANRANGSSSGAGSAYARSSAWRNANASRNYYPYDDDSEHSDTDGYTYTYNQYY